MIWCPPPRHSWQKLALLLISLQRVEKERKGKNVEKPRKWKFLDSLFKSHPSPQALRTCLDLPCRQSCKPPPSQWPSPSLCCGPGDALLQPHLLPGLWAACQPRQSGKLHTWSQMERVPTVSCLRDRTDFRFLRRWCTGPGLRRQKPQLLCTSCSSRPSSS